VREASDLFSDSLLEDVAIERQVRDDLFQLPILLARRPQLPELLDPHAGELLLPPIERLLTDAQSSADLGDCLAALDLPEGVDNLFVATNPKAISSWPDGEEGGRPRSACVVITKDDGGPIGS
jgi:hypothetical protein